jgi:hypothetical protein
LGKFVKVAALLLALILPFQASAGVFGYYHTSPEDVAATWPHTNLVHVQAANPLTVTLDEAAEIHPNARLAFEFGALAVSMHGQNGCGFGKCLDYNSERTALILDAVETLVEPHHDKMFALMIGDGLGLPGKTRGLYDLQIRMARDRGIEVLGSLAFAYRYPEDFSILSGSDSQRAAWVDLGQKIVSGVPVTPETTTFYRWWIPRDYYWRFRR